MPERAARMIVPEEVYETDLLPNPVKPAKKDRISQDEDVPDIGELINKRRLAEEDKISEEIEEARKKNPIIGENRKKIAKGLQPKGGKKDKGRRSNEY